MGAKKRKGKAPKGGRGSAHSSGDVTSSAAESKDPWKLRKAILAAGLTPAALVGGVGSGITGAEASVVQQQPADPSAAVFQRSPGFSSELRTAPFSRDSTTDVPAGYPTFPGNLAAPAGSSSLYDHGGSSLASLLAESSSVFAAASASYALNFSEQWNNFVEVHNHNLAEQIALAIVDLADRYAGNKTLSPEFKRRLARDVLAGTFGITPEQAAAFIVAPIGTASPPLLPVINAIYRGPLSFYSIYSEEWKNFIGPHNANLGTAIELALAIVDRANHFAGKKELSPGFKHGFVNTILTGSYNVTPKQAEKLLAEPLTDPPGKPSPHLNPIVNDLQMHVNPFGLDINTFSSPVRMTPSIGGVLANPSTADVNPSIADALRTPQSPLDSPDQVRRNSPAMWWSEGKGQTIRPVIVKAETSKPTLAINARKYPALGALIRHADDADGYLRMLGLESLHAVTKGDQHAVAKGEEGDESGSVKVCKTEKISFAAALMVLAGSGVIAVAGASTGVLSAAGAAIGLGSLGSAIAALNTLKECLRSGKVGNVEKLVIEVEKLQKELTDLRARGALT